MGYSLIDFYGLFRFDFLHELGRDAGIDTSCFYIRMAKHDGACGDDSSFAYDSMVKQDSAYADERSVTDFSSVNRHVMSDGNIITYIDDRLFVQGMQHRAVLYVDAIADTYRIDVSAQDRTIPDTATLADDYIADYHRIIRHKSILSNYGGKASYRFYKRHNKCLLAS